jgi:hypothetical protein
MNKYDLQNEVYRMICAYYDNNYPDTPDEAISGYLKVLFSANAKDTRKAYNYWKEVTL